MKKKRIIMISVILTAFLITGITALAATCPACEMYNVQAECKYYKEHMWHNTASHKVKYSEGGVLKEVACYINYSENKEWWECPNGHGTVMTRIHYQEIHSDSHCNDLDYYY